MPLKYIKVVILISLLLSGCGLRGTPDPGKIQDQLLNMKGYACVGRISHQHYSQTNTYEVRQVYHIDGRYREEVTKPENLAGLTTVFNGDKIIQYNPKVGQSHVSELTNNDFRNQLFLGSFIKNYLQSEDVSIEVQASDPGQTTVLEAVIPGGSRYMAWQRLWIDQKTYKPLQMIIYDKNDKEVVIVEFLEFTYNPQIDESIFAVEQLRRK